MDSGNRYKKGRGASINTANRFERYSYEQLPEDEEKSIKTKFIEIAPKSIVNKVHSPDVGMEYSLNPYQGCEHGCTYCYARPTHEFWGYSAGVDFEQTILVKKNAEELLRNTFEKRSWEVKPIVLSGNTDCYQPAEKEFEITRELLQVFLEYQHPVGIITKNALLLRDLDIIEQLSEKRLISINVSITTLDESLRSKLEPRTSTIKKRLEMVGQLSSLNVPVHVMMSPAIPALNDHELLPMAKASKEAGASSFSSHIVRLMGKNEELFERWLDAHFPDRSGKVMQQIRSLHNGRTGSSEFGVRGRGVGVLAENLRSQRKLAIRKYFPDQKSAVLETSLFRRPSDQLRLF
ncbi:MAG: PA0069 family radical SAM protein [Fluviicola sp.]